MIYVNVKCVNIVKDLCYCLARTGVRDYFVSMLRSVHGPCTKKVGSSNWNSKCRDEE